MVLFIIYSLKRVEKDWDKKLAWTRLGMIDQRLQKKGVLSVIMVDEMKATVRLETDGKEAHDDKRC